MLSHGQIPVLSGLCHSQMSGQMQTKTCVYETWRKEQVKRRKGDGKEETETAREKEERISRKIFLRMLKS